MFSYYNANQQFQKCCWWNPIREVRKNRGSPKRELLENGYRGFYITVGHFFEVILQDGVFYRELMIFIFFFSAVYVLPLMIFIVVKSVMKVYVVHVWLQSVALDIVYLFFFLDFMLVNWNWFHVIICDFHFWFWWGRSKTFHGVTISLDYL